MDLKIFWIYVVGTCCTTWTLTTAAPASPDFPLMDANETTIVNKTSIVLENVTLTDEAAIDGAIHPLKAGTMKKIQLFVGRFYLHMNSDGVVNGSLEKLNNETVWRRIAVNSSEVVIQSVAHCLYLCMNECGYVYSIDKPNHDCIFREVFKENNYEFIMKKLERKHAYLAMDVAGHTRRIVMRRKEPLGESLDRVRVMVTPWDESLTKVTITDICAPLNRTKLSYRPKKSCKNSTKKRYITDGITPLTNVDYEDDLGVVSSVVEEPPVLPLVEGVEPKNFYLPEETENLSILLLPNSTTARPPTTPPSGPTVEEFIHSIIKMPRESLLFDKTKESTEARQVFMKFENNFYVNKCIVM